LIVDAVLAIDFVHAMVYGAAIILLLHLGTIAMYGPSIVRVMREKRELRRLRTDIDVALEQVLPSRHLPRDQLKALTAARRILETVRSVSRADTHEPAADELAAWAEYLLLRLESDEADLGPNHPNVGEALAQLRDVIGRMASSEAEPLISRVIPIARRVSRSMRDTRIDVGPLVREQGERG